MKQIIGISLQDKYGLGGTKPSDYVYDKDGEENENYKIR